MTKYILVGGYAEKAKDGGKAFAEAFVEDLPEPTNILICAFARKKDEWQEVLEEENKFFSLHLPSRKITCKLASEENFSQEVAWANAIFMKGGDTHQLIKALKKDLRWLKNLDGKTLGGSSAGAYAIARYGHPINDPGGAQEGLDILPIKIIAHWKSPTYHPGFDWDKAYQELKDYKEELPLYTLAEGEYKVIQE